nr:M48 family metalloprotease [Thermoanaerobaculia bacterium]
GHEIAHVVARHGVRMERRSTLLSILSQAVMVGVMVNASKNRDPYDPTGPQHPRDPGQGPEVDPNTASVEGAVASTLVLSELLLRSYSRDFEREADDEGQRYAAAAGFAPSGTTELMSLMSARLPQSREFGYWQTHPFFDERVRGAEVRASLLTRMPGRDPSGFRQRTQEALLGYLKTAKKDAKAEELIDHEALLAWPKGTAAEQIRLGRLHQSRDKALAEPELGRDYGSLLGEYRGELAKVRDLDAQSPLVATLEKEIGELEAGRDALYPKASEVVAGGVYETAFLEKFLSNFPGRPEIPTVALALGDAYSRRQEPGKAVEQYRKAWESAPTSPAGQKALTGLRVLVPLLDDLAVLEDLASRTDEAELAGLANQRLAATAGSYKDLANGAAYLKQYPEGGHAETVLARQEVLADQLYTEMVLYQGVGDSVKALDRINRILTHAPTTRAAARVLAASVVKPS